MLDRLHSISLVILECNVLNIWFLYYDFLVVSIGAIDVLFLFVLMIFKYQNKKNTRCLIIIIFSSFTFDSKNNNILQIGTTLNNEASVLQSFFQIFGGMTPRYFSRKSAIWKIIN